MTITSSTEVQAGAASKQLQKAEEKAAERSAEKAAAKSDVSESPAVVDETTRPTEATVAAGPELGSADEALKAAQSIGAALAEENSAIANGNPSQISGLLSEFEAA